jgi:hypothetical protein
VPALAEWEALLKTISNNLSSPDPQMRNAAYLRLFEVILDPSEEGMRLRSRMILRSANFPLAARKILSMSQRPLR